ncbi:ABC transporter ATP-binding protein [Pseudogracilibacillus auburnensis]|uniref:ABC-2 type transport system ATP-binding protein n=1 Tax=Pseudogracilibacillus auburnensis TaxID=1494959 RepID=A0A2V3VXG3_9BACI|nr:ABC transporter ATP-binding protein [Pseudogracilibacillus auburnensis]PXW85624.1 ABC-2 type transport system ATP-binding protein [Pseudogracilibacillus auburnensis]
MTILEVKNLTKEFKDQKAVQGISFELYSGEILGLLGPNGAGKSTTINMLSMMMHGDDGEIYFHGKRVGNHKNLYKRQLGIVPQDIAIYEEITAEANVMFFASLYGLKGPELIQSVHRALDFVGLLDKKTRKPKTFSGGMKRRLNIACAIAHEPEILIMDEPTVGIDPQSRKHILQSIKQLKEQGTSVIYTTHYMEEVEEVATRVVIMDHGKVIANGTKEALKEELEEEKLYEIVVDQELGLLGDEWYEIEGVKQVDMEGTCIRIATVKGIENLDKIISFLIDKGVRIQNITSLSQSLEMVFLKLTGRRLRDEGE